MSITVSIAFQQHSYSTVGNSIGEIWSVPYGPLLTAQRKYEYCNLPWTEEHWLENNSRRVPVICMIGIWRVWLIDEYFVCYLDCNYSTARKAGTYILAGKSAWRGWDNRCSQDIDFGWFDTLRCRVVRFGKVVVIQREGWVVVGYGERPEGGTPQLTSLLLLYFFTSRSWLLWPSRPLRPSGVFHGVLM